MRKILFVLMLSWLTLGTGKAHACSCIFPTKSADELIGEGWIAVRGVAQELQKSSSPAGKKFYNFKVSSSVNARLSGDITLWTASSSAACGSDLKLGVVSVVAIAPDNSGAYSFHSCGQLAVRHDLAGWNKALNTSQ